MTAELRPLVFTFDFLADDVIEMTPGQRVTFDAFPALEIHDNLTPDGVEGWQVGVQVEGAGCSPVR